MSLISEYRSRLRGEPVEPDRVEEEVYVPPVNPPDPVYLFDDKHPRNCLHCGEPDRARLRPCKKCRWQPQEEWDLPETLALDNEEYAAIDLAEAIEETDS